LVGTIERSLPAFNLCNRFSFGVADHLVNLFLVFLDLMRQWKGNPAKLRGHLVLDTFGPDELQSLQPLVDLLGVRCSQQKLLLFPTLFLLVLLKLLPETDVEKIDRSKETTLESTWEVFAIRFG
jgi:hypothetical protein